MTSLYPIHYSESVPLTLAAHLVVDIRRVGEWDSSTSYAKGWHNGARRGGGGDWEIRHSHSRNPPAWWQAWAYCILSNAETHTKREATQHGCLPSLIGNNKSAEATPLCSLSGLRYAYRGGAISNQFKYSHKNWSSIPIRVSCLYLTVPSAFREKSAWQVLYSSLFFLW